MLPINKYALILLGVILSATASFFWGYVGGLNDERTKNMLQTQEIEIKRLNGIILKERDNSLVANNKSKELENNLITERNKNDIITKSIEADKDSINKLNIINRNFVRYIQATSESMPITSIARESSESNSSVPADRVLHYTIDLKSAFDKCRQQNNSLIDLYNFIRD